MPKINTVGDDSGKSTLTCTVDVSLHDRLEKHIEEGEFSSKSATLNHILYTYFKDVEQQANPLPYEVLIPVQVLRESNNISHAKLQSLVAQNKMKFYYINAIEYVGVDRKRKELLALRLDQETGLMKKLSTLTDKLDLLLEKENISIDYLKDAYSNFKESEDYNKLFDSVYTSLIEHLKNHFPINKNFFLENSVDTVFSQLNPEFKNDSSAIIIKQFLAFLFTKNNKEPY